MSADLGTWPAEQATVLLEVLTEAGLHPDANRTRDGVRVQVPDDESDQAQTTLVGAMDRIARAARPVAIDGGRSDRSRSKGRSARRSARAEASRPREKDRTLISERMLRLAIPISLVLIGLLVAALVPSLQLPIVIVVVVGLIYVLGRQSQRDDGSG